MVCCNAEAEVVGVLIGWTPIPPGAAQEARHVVPSSTTHYPAHISRFHPGPSIGRRADIIGMPCVFNPLANIAMKLVQPISIGWMTSNGEATPCSDPRAAVSVEVVGSCG